MVEGGSKDQKTVFYTGLYHALIHPNILQNILFSFLTSHSHSSRDEYGQLKRLAVFIPASVGEQCLIIKSSDIFSSK